MLEKLSKKYRAVSVTTNEPREIHNNVQGKMG